MKQRLFWNWRYLSLVLFASLGVAVAASSGAGYLRRVGPAPLRFSPVLPPPRACRFVLPAPVPVAEPSPIAAQIEKAQASAPKPSAIVSQATSGAAQPPMEPVPPDVVISPQMLLRYFNPSTNSAAVGAPMNFNPPKAARPSPGPAAFLPSP